MPITAYPHIEIIDGVPHIAGTRTKVIEVVLDRLAHGWGADEIHEQYPYLSLSQIHAAFTYYYDHQEELDRDIEARSRRADELLKQVSISPLQLRLQAKKLSR